MKKVVSTTEDLVRNDIITVKGSSWGTKKQSNVFVRKQMCGYLALHASTLYMHKVVRISEFIIYALICTNLCIVMYKIIPKIVCAELWAYTFLQNYVCFCPNYI